ncbi:MAG TPA: phosphoribosylformylglycinamidine cyclo-ligase [Kofleriaceae bacterium]|jgi:phosphoribosylformylglycinamidine cyclo-ligase|nr:phosphoribosylformylglycinamidine cyclo-ligase [Kofleriaceae bacterium]
MAITYKDAGVDIDAGDALVERIKPLAAATVRPEVLGGLGGFAGLCRLPSGYRDPVLVSGTDGVGTKLKTAFATGRHDGVGIDLVAMCVNDIAVTGAEPLFFLDYFATGKLDVAVARDVIAGISSGCQEAGCALLGGETAELPGFYADGEYDLAGFCVGVVERADIRDGSQVSAGDVVLGLPSSGLHANGHSLARKVVQELLTLGWDERPEILGGGTVADELIRPTRIYVKQLAALGRAGIRFKAAAHITGGGLVENPPRVIPAHLAFRLETGRWEVPGIFRLIAGAGVELGEMRRTFNMGLGMLVVVAAEEAERAREVMGDARVVGDIVLRRGEAVEFV